MSYNSLHNHNSFSLLDGLGTPEQFAKKANELGYKYLAITNHGSVDGVIKFQKACLDNDITPIIGIEFYIVPDGIVKEKEKRGHLTAWVKNQTGYENVLKMVTISQLDFFYRRPRIDYETLLNHCEGLCIGTACSASFLNNEGGVDFFHKLHDKIKDDLYLEIMPHDYEDQHKINELCLKLNKETGVKLIVTNDCHYVNAEDTESHEVLLACQTKAKWSDPKRWRFSVTGLHLCEPEFIVNKFKEQGKIEDSIILQAMDNTQEICEKCEDFRIDRKEIILPLPPQYEGMDEEQVFRDLCEEGFKNKFDVVTQEYRDRFEYEFSVIKDFGVVRYFLIVADLINWCEENDILVGGGRGSSAGCLCSYLMNIVKVDPIKYGLFFERFLNPGRKGANGKNGQSGKVTSMPDIDVDFMDSERITVINRLRTIYGDKHIAYVSTFLSIEDKTAIRDVARVFDVNLMETNNFSKSIVEDLETALETPDGRNYQNRYPEVVNHAFKLKGQIKALGKHASALLVSPVDLTLGTRCALSNRNGNLTVNLDGEDAENQGLIKLDVLGLSTLTVVSMALKTIKQNHGITIDLQKIPLDDKNVYEQISAGNNTGCFQIGTFTLTKLIKDMGVSSITELSDAVSLCRPGPFDSGATEKYIDRKHGSSWELKHPIYEEITKDTHSIIVYQEQIIQVIHKIAGLSLADADAIRKIVGKKKSAEEFLPFKQSFVDGCLKNETFSEKEAEEFWEELKHHASYSFNKSHSLSYSILSYHTAYLKYYYPTEFLCASLTHGSAGMKLDLIKEAQRLNLEIIPPRVGRSDVNNWIAKDGKLYVPFIEIAGIGPKMAETLQNFISFKDDGFFSDKEKPVIKGKLKTILEDIGAFDGKMNDDIDKYFDIGVTFVPKVVYPKLYDLVGINNKNPIYKLLSGDFKARGLTKVASRKRLKGLTECDRCSVRKGCKYPINTTNGLYNVMILNENANWLDEKSKKHCTGDSFDKLVWPVIESYGYEKEDFIKSSIVKCSCKRPGINVIQNCSGWLKEEIKQKEVYLVLSFGNASVKLFKGEETGIQRLNGTCEWNEEYGCYVLYCVSPFTALMHVDARVMFDHAIKNFVEKLTLIGGFE